MRIVAACLLAALLPATAAAGDDPVPQAKPATLAAAEAAAAPEEDARMMAAAAPGPRARPVPRTGDSGLPVPRFVSLKADEVRLREGPSTDHRVMWVYVRRGLPVEVIAENDNWRRIRDPDGVTGWVSKALLDGRRRVLVIGAGNAPLREAADRGAGIVAYAEPGAILKLEACAGEWCEVEGPGAVGYVERASLWVSTPTRLWNRPATSRRAAPVRGRLANAMIRGPFPGRHVPTGDTTSHDPPPRSRLARGRLPRPPRRRQ